MTLMLEGDTMKKLRQSAGVRYFAASIGALAVDYILTLVLYYAAEQDLSVAAAISFFSSGAIFYFVHEFWTFKEGTPGFSGARMVANLTVLCLAGGTRVAIISLLEHMRAPEGLWVSLYFGFGVAGSFTTNYVLNRHLVFRR